MRRRVKLKLYFSGVVLQFVVAVILTMIYGGFFYESYFWSHLAIAITIVVYWGLHVLMLIIALIIGYVRWLIK